MSEDDLNEMKADVRLIKNSLIGDLNDREQIGLIERVRILETREVNRTKIIWTAITTSIGAMVVAGWQWLSRQ